MTKEIVLTLIDISYIHTNKDILFENVNASINLHDKIALIGNNGSGKSTLLGIMAGVLRPSTGTIETIAPPYYVPQHFGQYNALTIAQALQIDERLQALRRITSGHATDDDFTTVGEDWLLEERVDEALREWGLGGKCASTRIGTLSGGEKTKAFLAGISIHQPEILLLDEPTNHLDAYARDKVYQYVRSSRKTLVVASHDKKLLNMLNPVYELTKKGITVFGGNYAFYAGQKNAKEIARNNALKSKEKALRKAKETERESLERKQKLDARGRKKQAKAGLPTIVMNALRNNAQKSTSRTKETHALKVEGITEEIKSIRNELPDVDRIRLDLDRSTLYHGKRLVEAKNINFGYNKPLLKEPLSFLVISGDRIAIKGDNGAGKTALIKVITGGMEPLSGSIIRTAIKFVYIDQDYSLISDNLSVYEQAQQFNDNNLQEHDIKIRLNRFLFTKEYWTNPCSTLSGGERMRLTLCCLMISNQAPDMIILDEPTNNLDIKNTEILTRAISEYQGTLLIVSHDEDFLKDVGVAKEIALS